MRNTFLAAAIVLGLGACVGVVSIAAQEASTQLHNQAVISAPEDAPVGRPILLDASLSRIVGLEAKFQWYASGTPEPISRTVDAIYTPDKPGPLRFRIVIRSMLDGMEQESQAVRDVTVYKRKMTLVADARVPPEKVAAQVRLASGSELYVKALRAPVASSSDRFVQFISDQASSFRGAEAIVLWTDGVNGLQALLQAFQRVGRPPELSSQSIVIVTGERLPTIAQTARAPFAVLQPRRIVLMHPDALGALFGAKDVDSFLATARERDLALATIDASTPPPIPWQALSLLVNALLIRGVASQTILLLLMLPVIATILSFLKQVVGITTFGLFVPSIIALSFLALGWAVGVLFFLFIMLVGIASRSLVHRLRILYIPKVAIIITVVSISLLLLLALNLPFGVILSRDAVFILLIMSTLSESFLTAKAEQGWLTAFSGIAQTLFAALLCVSIVQWSPLQTLVLAYPEVILFTIVFNILIGRYTGLRLSEYVRFREVLKHVPAE